MSTSERGMLYGSSTVEKAIDILEAVASAKEGMSSQQISDHLGLDRSTVHRLVTTLERRRLIDRLERRKFTVGSYLHFLALGAGFDIGAVIRSTLADIVAATGESASFSIMRGNAFHCVYNHLSPHDLSFCPTAGADYPLYSGAAGYALWAFLPSTSRDHILEEIAPEEFTESTITDKDELRAVLKETLDRGYGRSAGVRTPGGCAIACPVMGRHNSVVGVLTLSAAEARIPLTELEAFVPLLQTKSRQLSDTLRGGH
jgi:DNA-binding IclR family transcriptional regulator